MDKKSKILSEDFIEVIRKSIILYFIAHPFMVLSYGGVFLLDCVIPNPRRRKCFVPKYVFTDLSDVLNTKTCGLLSTIARGAVWSEEEYYVLGEGVFSKDFKEAYWDRFPYASWIPNFFELLYEELEKASEFPSSKWWYLKKEKGVLYLYSPKEALDAKVESVESKPFQKAISF